MQDLAHAVLEKLGSIIVNKFGCNIRSVDMNALTHELRAELQNGQPLTQAENVYIPILTGAGLESVVCIEHAHDLAQKDVQYIHSITQMLLETTIKARMKLERLEMIESQLSTANQSQARVIPLSHFRDNQFTILSSPSSEYSESFDFPCLIESSNSTDIFKMALEVHQTAARFVFLPFRDLEAGIEKSIESLAKIGQVTIFIDEIKSLSHEQQTSWLDFLKQRVPHEHPQIIVGSTTPYGQLKKDSAINQEFLKEITIGYLHMSQPFSIYKRENLLQFFFEGLSGRHLSAADSSSTNVLFRDGDLGPSAPTH